MLVFFEILVCCLAIVGIYAIFLRISVWLMPHENLVIAIRCDGMDADTLLAQAQRLKLYAESDAAVEQKPVALLDESSPMIEHALREEGIAVYIKRK